MLEIGKIYEYIGDPKTAVTWYEKAFKRNPNHQEIVYRFARLTTDGKILKCIFEQIDQSHAIQAFCFGCAETGNDLVIKILDKVRNKWPVKTHFAIHSRYFGWRGEMDEQMQLLDNYKAEEAQFIKFLISLNCSDLTKPKSSMKSFKKYLPTVQAVWDIIQGNARQLDSQVVVPLIIDWRLQALFESCLLCLPDRQQEEALLTAKRGWNEAYDLSTTESTCGTAYDIKTEKSLRSSDFLNAEVFLKKAQMHGETILRYLHQMELYRRVKDENRLLATAEQACNMYPESILVQTAANIVKT